MMVLSPSARHHYTSGKIMTLFSDDVNQITHWVLNMHRTIVGPFDILSCVLLLFYQTGTSTFVGLSYAILAMITSMLILRQAVGLQKSKLYFTEIRNRLTSELLTYIRVIRLNGWESVFMKKILEAREEETRYLAYSGHVNHTLSAWMLICSPRIQSVLVFTCFVYTGHVLTLSIAFSALTIFGVMASSMIFIPVGVNYYVKSIPAVKRVLEFLEAEEISPYITYHHDDDFDNNDNINRGVKPERGDSIDQTLSTRNIIQWENATLAWNDNTESICRLQCQVKSSSASLSSRSCSTASNLSTLSKPDSCTSNRSYNTFHYSPINCDGDELAVSSEEGDDFESTTSSDHRKYAIRNINLSVEEGALVAIVGVVGSGKSSLLSSVMGEMALISGKLSIHHTLKSSHIACCEQCPWIVSGTVTENITLGSSKPCLDANHLATAITASGLEQDLLEWPNGLKTEVGEKGKILSGGQRARLSFARAIYSDARIVLLDDVLCAVDAHVAKHMFHEGIVKALAGRTRLFVTNEMKWLPYCDKIVSLSEQGELEFVGNFEEYSQWKQLSILSNNADVDARNLISDNSSEIDDGSSKKDKLEKGPINESLHNTPRQSITVDEALPLSSPKSPPTMGWQTYWSYVCHGGLLLSAFCGIFLIASQGFQLFASAWLEYWGSMTEDVDDETSTQSYQAYYLKRFIYLQVSGVFAMLVYRYCFIEHRRATSHTYHLEMLTTLLQQKLSYFDIIPIGKLLNRFVQDLLIVDDDMTFNIMASADLTVSIAGAVLIIAISTHGYMLLVVCPLFALQYWMYRKYSCLSVQIAKADADARAAVHIQFSQTMVGAQSIRSYHCEKDFVSSFETRVDRNTNTSITVQSSIQWMLLRSCLIGSTIIFAIGVLDMTMSGKDAISGGYLAMALSYAIQLNSYIRAAFRLTSCTESQFMAVHLIDTMIEENITNIASRRDRKPESTTVYTHFENNCSIEFKDVTMKYEYGPVALKRLSFFIQKGEHIGVVGRTGSGKSSLITAMLGLEDLVEGRILMDGFDILSLSLDLLRSAICLIPQEPTLFQGSLRVNIDPKEEFTDADIWNALSAVQLTEVIEQYPNRLDTIVSEGGGNFSAGQRQLLCITRAILRKPQVLIMDEATAFIDHDTDAVIQAIFQTYFANCTIITIAHRLQTVMNCDRIMVLDKGSLLEFDRPSALLAKEDGVFKSLCDTHNKK